jgi:hypothetical protein
VSQEGHDFQSALADFKQGGWLIAILGAAGMAARMLLTDRNSTLIQWIRRITAGAIVGVLAFFATHGSELSPFYKSIICSTAGAIAPEAFEFLIGRVMKLNARE